MAITARPLQHVMKQPVVTVRSELTVEAAQKLARLSRVHHLPVMDGEELVGMICSCDMAGASAGTRVAAAMSAPAVSLAASESTLAAAATIRHQGVGAIVVLDDAGAPCGVVTRGDLLQPDSGVAEVLEDCRCACCGLTRHLRTDDDGKLLCMYCREDATDGSWLELSGED